MKNQTSVFTLPRRRLLVIMAVTVIGFLGAVFLARPALADTPIFVRPGGDDAACHGAANVDYSPAVAPVCAVKTPQRALSLAGSANTIILDTGSQTITIPPIASPSESGDISMAEAELVVDKTDSEDSVWVENPLTYTIRISNVGDTPTNVQLTDSLPQVGLVSFKSVAVTGGISHTCNLWEPFNVVGCLLEDLGSNSTVTATIVVTPTAVGNIYNNATATGLDSGDSDDEWTYVEGITNLSVSKIDDPDPVIQGQPLTYTITVTNGGPSAAITVVLTDVLPLGTTFGSTTSSQGECGSGAPLTCTLGLMADNEVATVTVVVTPTTFGWITNTVTVGGGDNDDLSNNTFTETTWVRPQADLQVSKGDEPDPVLPGGTLTYTLTVHNNGPGPATGVTLADALPDDFNFNTASGNMLLLHLDELTGATSFADASGNNHHGSCNDLTGTCPTAGVSGPSGFGAALQFDGVNDFVNLANPSGLNIDGQITLMAWVNISDTLTLQNIIAHGHTASPSPAGVHLRIFSGYYQVGSWNGVDSLTSWPIPGGDVGNWVHLAGVYSGSDWQLYHNGLPVGTPYGGPGALSVAENWAIGAMGDGSNRFFEGLIDEVAIFDRALSAAEIAAIYDEALTGQIHLDPDQGSCGSVGGGVQCNLGNLNASEGVTVTLIGTVASTATGTILNTVTVTTTAYEDSEALDNNTANETTDIDDGNGGPGGPITVYLPIILKNFANPTLSLYWNDWEPVRDKVSPLNGGAGLAPDGREDGVFRAILDMGSQTKTVVAVDLTTTQGAGIIWDTIATSGHWLLGVFDSVALNDSGDGTIDQEVSGLVEVTLYASDVESSSPLYSLFPPDEYTYTATVYFDDGSSLSASARIPPEGEPPEPPQPPPPPEPSACQPIAEIEVGDDPRGVVVDESRNRVYVANYESNSVSVIDSSSNSVLRTIGGVTTANGLALDQDRNVLWVTNYSTDQATTIQNPDSAGYSVGTPLTVGDGPWGVAYVNDYIYVANRNSSTVTVIDADNTTDRTTLGSGFNQPYHLAANPNSHKVYVANFGNHTVTVINGRSVSGVINLNTSDPSTQPYGIAVDEIRNVVYVAAVNSHRIVAIDGAADAILGWAAFHRGFGDPARPVPMRAIAVNPDIGPFGDGGHLWTTTSTADGSEINQALLIPKGWSSYFHQPVPCDVGIDPSEGIAVHRSLDRAYVSSGNDTDNSPGILNVFEDPDPAPLVPFSAADGIGIEVFRVE